MGHRPAFLVAAAWGFVVALSSLEACATGRGPGTSGYPFNVDGAYEGSFLFDGQPFAATLRLRTSVGGHVEGAFRVAAPFDIDGPVTGSVRDDLLRITVEYTNPDGCDGRIEGILTVERGGGTIGGPVTVTDCGAPVSGRMDFRRLGRNLRLDLP